MPSTSEGAGPRVVVAGGSIGGLAAATALHAIGCDVEVHERSDHALASRGAGIVVQPELLGLLRDVRAGALPTTRCSRRRYLGPEGGGGSASPMPQEFTSWEAIYGALRSVLPGERYHLGSGVVAFQHDATARTVDVHLDSGATSEADLLVCADGWRSAARARLLPDITPLYAGYVAFRGTVMEMDAPEDLAAFFEDTFTFPPLGPEDTPSAT